MRAISCASPAKAFCFHGVGLCLATALGGLQLDLRAAEGPAERPAPPVRKVVLYKHGIGYFERRGRVRGDALLRMSFKTAQMKDLLTSLFVLDLGGGRVGAIRYDTKDPVGKQLEGILIDVPENRALSAFLTRLKGASVRVTAADQDIIGRVMGVEPVTERIGQSQTRTGYRLVLLDEVGSVRSVDLYSLGEILILDEEIRRDLVRLMDIHRASKFAERKALTVECRGEGEREVRIGYLIETPIWKASYRVIFAGKGAPLVQGWALAENTTEEDWESVQLSFVAGNPLSYIMDLYTPYYPKRQTVPIPGLTESAVNWGASPEASAMRPEEPAEEKRLADAGPGGRGARRHGKFRIAAEAAPAAPERRAKLEPTFIAERAQRSVAAAAAALKVGELFAYESKSPVTVPRGKAAMVPIVSEKIGGERVVYYKRAFSARAVNAFVFKNTTKLTLEAGAVTFFEGSTSLGAGILSHVLVPGAKEIVPYAVEAAVSVEPKVATRAEPEHRGVVADGVLTLFRNERLSTEYRLSNKGKEKLAVLLDHPRNPAFELARPEKPEEQVEGHYRFRAGLAPGAGEVLKVVERREVSRAFAVRNASLEQVAAWIRAPFFSPAAKRWMREVREIMAERAALQRRVTEMQAEVQRLSREEDRLRRNMGSLRTSRPQEAALRAKFVTQLEKAEVRIVELREELNEAGKSRVRLDEALARKVREYRGE